MSPPPSSLDGADGVALNDAISLYPSVLEAFYDDKLKGDQKKRKEAVEDDEWRYETLPAEVGQRDVGEGITKDELIRLVRWKITHQKNRPFLLPQIRKNSPESVESCSAAAREILLAHRPPSEQHVRQALDKVCELIGVGPATGTLILSIYDQRNVPFFEDELHAWLSPGGTGKLKYNVKEYFEVWNELRKAHHRPLGEHLVAMGLAHVYEKVAFVHQHWDLVSHSERLADLHTAIEAVPGRQQVEKNISPVKQEGNDRAVAEEVGENIEVSSRTRQKRKMAEVDRTATANKKSKRKGKS